VTPWPARGIERQPYDCYDERDLEGLATAVVGPSVDAIANRTLMSTTPGSAADKARSTSDTRHPCVSGVILTVPHGAARTVSSGPTTGSELSQVLGGCPLPSVMGYCHLR